MHYSNCEFINTRHNKSCTCGNNISEIFGVFLPNWIKVGRNDIADFPISYAQQLPINRSHSLVMFWLKREEN
jgi:hypothetical protein